MMTQVHVWQMVIDLCLVTAILLFSFRWVRGEHAKSLLPRTLELEASLRNLIQEADGAGRHLNDQLLKREQSLQRVLAEIDSTEQKLSRTIGLSEERERGLSTESEKASALITELSAAIRDLKVELQQESVHHQESSRAQTATNSRQREQVQVTRNHQPPRESREILTYADVSDVEAYEEEQRVEPTRSETTRLVPTPASPAQFAASPMSVRGSARTTIEIQTPSPRVSARSSDEHLSNQQRTKQSAVYQETGRGYHELQQVYATAENLIKQGQKLDQISAQTRLPVEEVRLLSQMIEIERNEEQERKQSQPAAKKEDGDPRLGALGGIRRQSATL